MSDTEISQQPTVMNFTRKPFRESEWEILGESLGEDVFLQLQVAVIEGESAPVDPMFESFSTSGRKVWSSAQNSDAAATKESSINLERLQQERQSAFEEGKKAGHEEGFAAGILQVEEKHQQVLAQFKQFTDEVSKRVQDHFRLLEQEALQFSLRISKKILETTVHVQPDYILQVIREGLKCLGAAKPLVIRVSADDLEFLEVIGTPPELSAQELGIKYVADQAITSGCVIETDFGEIDLQLDKMWEQVRAELYEVGKT